MRTTLTLDEDIAAKVQQDSRRTGRSFKATVNELLRQALSSQAPRRARKRFAVRPKSMGVGRVLDEECVWKLLEDLEGPAYR